MIAAMLRTVFGFLLASLAAATTQVLFVITPVDLYQLSADDRLQQMGFAALIALSAATQSALFAAPFAIVAVLIGRLFDFRGWAFYVFAGLLIALAGFLAIYVGETGQGPTIANSYAIAAFAFSGIIAGYVFWLIARPRDAFPPGDDFEIHGHRGPDTGRADSGAEGAAETPGNRPHLKARDYAAANAAELNRPAPLREWTTGNNEPSRTAAVPAYRLGGTPATTH